MKISPLSQTFFKGKHCDNRRKILGAALLGATLCTCPVTTNAQSLVKNMTPEQKNTMLIQAKHLAGILGYPIYYNDEEDSKYKTQVRISKTEGSSISVEASGIGAKLVIQADGSFDIKFDYNKIPVDVNVKKIKGGKYILSPSNSQTAELLNEMGLNPREILINPRRLEAIKVYLENKDAFDRGDFDINAEKDAEKNAILLYFIILSAITGTVGAGGYFINRKIQQIREDEDDIN